MRIRIFCIALLISNTVLANVTIKEISTVRKMVIATSSKDFSSIIRKGSEFLATFNDNTQCTMKVVKIKDKKIFLDASQCKVDSLQKGQVLQASAFNDEDKNQTVDKPIGDSHLEEFRKNTNLQENWYTMWNYAPLTSITTGESVGTKFKDNATFLGMDILGFYWPMFEPGFILGGVFNYYNHAKEADEFSYSVFEVQNYNASALYFFNGEVGRGFFLRGDLGLRLTRFEYAPKVITLPGVVTSAGSPVENKDRGLNVAFGVGGSMPVSREARLLFQVLYSTTPGDSDTDASAIQFLVGVLL